MARPLTQLHEQVLGYINEEGPVSVADVARSMMVSDSRARSAIEGLARRGFVDATYTGHDRGRGTAYVTTDAGEKAAAEAFADGEDSDEPIPLRITARPGGTFIRRYITDRPVPASYGLTWDRLHPTEQAAVTAAQASADGTAVIRHVTAVVTTTRGERDT